MTPKFKIGDKIRNVSDNDTEIPVDYKAVVYGVEELSVCFDDQEGFPRQRPSVNYELVTEVPAQPVFDAAKLRKGDKVLILATVEQHGLDFYGDTIVSIGGNIGYRTLKAPQIVDYAPGYVPAPIEAPLKIGDMVNFDGGQHMRIERINLDGTALLFPRVILNGGKTFFVHPLAELKRVPQ